MTSPSYIEHIGPWQLPYKAYGVVCPDGKRRVVLLTSTPDTFWTIRGRISYKGVTVTGAVMHRGNDSDETLDLKFIPAGVHADIFENKAGNDA